MDSTRDFPRDPSKAFQPREYSASRLAFTKGGSRLPQSKAAAPR